MPLYCFGENNFQKINTGSKQSNVCSVEIMALTETGTDAEDEAYVNSLVACCYLLSRVNQARILSMRILLDRDGDWYGFFSRNLCGFSKVRRTKDWVKVGYAFSGGMCPLPSLEARYRGVA